MSEQAVATSPAADAVSGVQASERFEINVMLIDAIPGHQHRMSRDPMHDAQRLGSMQNEGQLQDITVRRSKTAKDRFELIDGEGRLSDIKAISGGAGSIGCRVVEASDAEAAILSLLSNSIRQGVNPMEYAYGLKRAIDTGMPVDECLLRLGRITADGKPDLHFGDQMMKLLELSPDEQKMVAEGMLTKQDALDLARLDKDIRARVITAAKEIEGEKENKRAAKKVRSDAPPPPPLPGAIEQPALLKLKPSTGETPKAEPKVSHGSVRAAKKKVGVKDGPRFIGLKLMKELEEQINTTDELKPAEKELIKKTCDYIMNRRKTIPF